MSKGIKLKNSTVLLIGILLIVLGVAFGLYEYFYERKNNAFSEMNIMLYENEKPKNIDKQDQNTNIDANNSEDTPKEDDNNQTNSVDINYNYIGVLEIPKINLKRGFLDLNSRYNNVDYNVTLIKGSTFPDNDKSSLILAAHSGVCSICYFNNLFNLSFGNQAYVYYNNIKYIYSLVDIYEVDKVGTVAIHRDYSKKGLVLITCTTNSDTKQTVFIFELINQEEY